MAADNEWSITISPDVTKGFGGFCPAWFENSYPYYGNKNQASAMENINIIDPNVLTQGPGAVDLTNGDENGVVTTLIGSILKTATSNDVSFAVGVNLVYQISSTTVTDDGTYPLTIDKGGVTSEDGDDLLHYKSHLYVFYNHSGDAGDIAKVDLSADTIDPDWGSTIPTGAATLEDAPHYAINAGDDVAYFTNGKYVGKIEGTTLDTQALDFWDDAQTVSLTWNQNRVWVAVNRPNIPGSNFNLSGIYKWDGVATSWEGDPIEVSGRIGALYTKNGITFVWSQDSTSTGGFNFGYISGLQLIPIKRFTGSLPNQSQVGEHKGFLAWISDNKLYLWGARDVDLPTNIFQYISGKQATVGAFACPFGGIIISSYSGSNYSLAKESGYTVDSNYNFIAYKMNGPGFKAQIDLIQIETEQMSTGAAVDFTLTYDKGKSTLSLDQIAYSTDNDTIHKILPDNKGPQIEDFRLDIDFANGSTTNPVKIRSILIQGRWIKSN